MKKRVLIVDDLPDIRLMLRYIVERRGDVIVGEAANGVEAVQQYREHLPDITIMDIEMPYKTGVEAAREILAHTNDAHIIFCSGNASLHDIASLRLGTKATRMIGKPFLPAQLYQAMSA